MLSFIFSMQRCSLRVGNKPLRDVVTTFLAERAAEGGSDVKGGGVEGEGVVPSNEGEGGGGKCPFFHGGSGDCPDPQSPPA